MKLRALALAALLLVAGSFLPATKAAAQNSGPIWGGVGNQSVVINQTGSAVVQLVPAVTGKWIYIGHFDFTVSAAATAQFEYGTGASCGTGTTVITGLYNPATTAPFSVGDNSGVILFVPAGAALCLVWNGSGTISGSLTYSQF